jgi:AmmeMemoRadiSam system protein A
MVRSLLESLVRGRADGEWLWESCGDLVGATVHCLAWGLHWEGLAWEHGQVDSGAGAAAVLDPTWAAGVFLDPPVGRLLTAEERWVALRLARHALDSVVRTGRLPEVKPAELPVALLARRACFVTLTKHGQLRGCIGHLTAQMPLYQAIMENARAAALQDYRFEPVRPSELPEIDIEISVLTPPRPLQYKSPEELLQRLRPGIDGVILELGPCSATFLPQVWEKLPSKEQFLDQLCLKAGCWPGDWRRPSVSVSTYQVEAFAEDDRPAVDGPVVAPQP